MKILYFILVKQNSATTLRIDPKKCCTPKFSSSNTNKHYNHEPQLKYLGKHAMHQINLNILNFNRVNCI